MAALPETVATAWGNREGPVVLTTVSTDGTPNSIYATCTARYGDNMIVVANNFFSKTMENLSAGKKASVLFITKEGKSYQVKGSIAYHTEGKIYDEMKGWNPAELPGHGAAAVTADEVYSGAEKLL